MSRSPLLLILTVVIVAAVAIYAHIALGYVCPLPWPDESHFVWPAISLVEHGTFIAPELNPERPIFWMPPGYVTTLGGVFVIFGTSLDTARWFSLVCVLISFVFLLLIFRAVQFSGWSYLIAGWFYLNANFVACGNVARMEALLLACALGGFYCLFSRRTVIGLAILALSPLIHPNGFYFLLAGIAHAAIEYRAERMRQRLTPASIVVVLAVVACWGLYAFQCLQNWAFVKSDLAFQFSRKGDRSILTTLLDWDNLALAIPAGLALYFGAYRNRARTCLLIFALAGWLTYLIGFEMWYRVYWALSALLTTSVFFESLREYLANRPVPIRPMWVYGIVGLISIVFATYHYARENLELPYNYPYEIRFFEMSTPDGAEYIIESDTQNINAIIAAESSNRSIVVQFYPRAEALLYLDQRSPRVQLSDPLFYTRQPDLCIFHESRYMPPRWTWFLSNDMKANGLDPANRVRYVIFERDNHERWYGFKP
jgi:hypothetical protein